MVTKFDKARNFCEISTVDLSYVVTVKHLWSSQSILTLTSNQNGNFLQTLVVFPEYLNFSKLFRQFCSNVDVKTNMDKDKNAPSESISYRYAFLFIFLNGCKISSFPLC